MKIWVDDQLNAPKGEGYTWVCRNINDVKDIIDRFELMVNNPDPLSTASTKTIDLIDIDMDLGDQESNGGTSYAFIRWLELNKKEYPIRIHAKNIYEAILMFKKQDWTPFIDKMVVLEENV